MPRRDQTGPSGQGSMTGRGFGVCNTSNAQTFGRGRGRGLGNGRFSNVPKYTPFTPNLEEEKDLLQNRLDEINKQLEK